MTNTWMKNTLDKIYKENKQEKADVFHKNVCFFIFLDKIFNF